MSVRIVDRRMEEIVSPDVAVEMLATGFMFTEGPVWMPDGSLHFSDMPADVRRRWHSENGASVIRRPANKCNGMALDANRNLYICEHVTSRVVMETPQGRSQVVASHYRGKELNSPNDVVVAGDGSVVFTDPDWGRTIPAVGLQRPCELDIRGVYRSRGPGSKLELLADDFAGPNGLCFSPDETRLYINDTIKGHIRVFDVGEGYRLSNGRLFAEDIRAPVRGAGVVDGMKVDGKGNVWVTGPDGLWVFEPSGGLLGVIEVPEVVANFAWGGPGWSELYLTASSSLYRIRTRASGKPPAWA